MTTGPTEPTGPPAPPALPASPALPAPGAQGSLAPSARRCFHRTMVVFVVVDAVFAVLLAVGYAQISNLPSGVAIQLGLTSTVPSFLLSTLILGALGRSVCRRLEDPGHTEASVRRAATALRRFPGRGVMLHVVRWASAFGVVFAIEQPAHWQPPVFFLITMIAGPFALSSSLIEWCNAPATAELWHSMNARGIAMPVRPVRLAARLAFYIAAIVTAVAAYFASFAFAAQVKQLALEPMLISILIFSSSALFFALICAFLFATTFTRPILEMSAIVSRIASDEQLANVGRVPLHQGDEVGALALLTNTMIDRLERTAAERAQALRSLEALNQTLELRVEDRTQQLTRVQAVAVASAHRAGMSEISTNVLHNVGNILNSVNVSCDQLEATLRASRVAGLTKAAGLLHDQGDRLASFLDADPKGRLLPEYLIKVSASLGQEHRQLVDEVARLKSQVHLINTVIASQQLYASGRFLTERADITEVVEDILAMQAHALHKSRVRVVKDLQPVEPVSIQRAKLAHVLVNLMKNAEEAMATTAADDRVLTIEVGGAARPFIHVRDTGEGISAENLTRIFQHGFTTKPTGHGFGLHSCASSMREMGGELVVSSEGPGRGATFTLVFDGARA